MKKQAFVSCVSIFTEVDVAKHAGVYIPNATFTYMPLLLENQNQ